MEPSVSSFCRSSMLVTSSPPTARNGLWQTIHRGSISQIVESQPADGRRDRPTVMIWPSTSTAQGTTTASSKTRISRSAMLVFPCRSAHKERWRSREISAGPSASSSLSSTTMSEKARRSFSRVTSAGLACARTAAVQTSAKPALAPCSAKRESAPPPICGRPGSARKHNRRPTSA